MRTLVCILLKQGVMLRAVVCWVLIGALLFPVMAQCAGDPGLAVERRARPASADRPAEKVVQAEDGCIWLWPVVRQIIFWIGGICFYKCVTYWTKSHEPPPALWQGPPEPPGDGSGGAGAWRR